MKVMPLPFPFDTDLRPNGLLNFTSVSDSPPPLLRRLNHPQKWSYNLQKEICYVGAAEPTSVLDTCRSPSPPTSTSTLSSSLAGAGAGGATASTDRILAAPPSSLPENPSPLDKCGGTALGIDDWDSVLPESPGQGPSILGLIMGDVEDPSLGLNKLLQSGTGGVGGGGGGGSHLDLEFSDGFSGVDHGFVFEPNTLAGESIVDPSGSDFHNGRLAAATNAMFSGVFQNQNQMMEGVDEKPHIFNSSPQVVMNQNQTQFTQNPPMFMPLPYTASPVQDDHHHLLGPSPAKRFNSGSIGANNNYLVKSPFMDSGQEMFDRRQQAHQIQAQLFPQQQQQHQRASMAAMAKQKMVNEEMANQQLQQGISEQLLKAVELIETGNSVMAQGILARLNQQLSAPIGKPFQRAAFYFKEALQTLLNQNQNHPSSNAVSSSPFSIIFKIAAYKSFSEVSPVLQFANFTSNQALLEALNGFDRIHIVDFDIGYGGQWASLMQELALMRNTGNVAPFLKITALAGGEDELEVVGFTRENLKNFANELSIGFEVEVVNMECLNSGSWPLALNVSENEAIAVNLPVGWFLNNQNSVSLPLVLRFVKHLSPKIVVCVDRGCNRMDAPFPHRVINALHSYTSLLESMDAVTVNMDTQLKIERYLLQPGIEKLVAAPQSSNQRLPPWRSLFLSSGFSPLPFSNFTESQAECLVHRTPVHGFHVDKRHSSLVLCWHRKDLVSISAWRC